MTGVFSQDDTAERFRRHIERKNRAIGTQRIGDLNKLYARRYGGREGYVFPDDDAGLEDLKILLHHYALNNPLAIPRIIKLRAPWADAQKLQEEIDAYGPRRWKSATLGKLLRFTGAEWQVLRLRTIEPIDMTKKHGERTLRNVTGSACGSSGVERVSRRGRNGWPRTTSAAPSRGRRLGSAALNGTGSTNRPSQSP